MLASACDIVSVSRETGRAVEAVGKLYLLVGNSFGFEWLRRMARTLPTERAWDKQAVAAVVDELLISQRSLVGSMLRAAAGEDNLEVICQEWIERRRPLVTRTKQLITELQATPSPDFAMLAVANRQLKAMLAGSGVN